jgi:hypothetical protein
MLWKDQRAHVTAPAHVSASFLVDVPILTTDADRPADVGMRRWC